MADVAFIIRTTEAEEHNLGRLVQIVEPWVPGYQGIYPTEAERGKHIWLVRAFGKSDLTLIRAMPKNKSELTVLAYSLRCRPVRDEDLFPLQALRWNTPKEQL